MYNVHTDRLLQTETQRQDSNFQTVISGHKSQSGLEIKTYILTDRPSVVMWHWPGIQWTQPQQVVQGVGETTSASRPRESWRKSRQHDPADHRSCEPPNASRIRVRSHDPHGSSYVGPASSLPSGNATVTRTSLFRTNTNTQRVIPQNM
jgi:hypothetical protein